MTQVADPPQSSAARSCDPRIVETHSALLLALGDQVFKVKKPVDLGFLDFSTLEARQAVCFREVEFNRRFAPDVYLGVATLHDETGAVCEHLVVMRRMPEDRALSALVRAGADVRDDLRRVARVIAALPRDRPALLRDRRGRLGRADAGAVGLRARHARALRRATAWTA